MGLNEPTNHPNANGSRLMALFNVVGFLLGLALPWITNHVVLYSSSGFIVSEALLFVLSGVFTVIGIKNRFATNDDWKSLLGWGAVIASVIVPLIFIESLPIFK